MTREQRTRHDSGVARERVDKQTTFYGYRNEPERLLP
jgi:hypothetical protein